MPYTTRRCRRLSVAAAVAAAALVAGCESKGPQGPFGPEVHRPRVERSVAVETVAFAADRAELSPDQRAALERFVRVRSRHGRLRLTVTGAPGGSEIDRRRRDAVLRLLRRYGMDASAGDPLAGAAAGAGEVAVRAESYRVALPNCPDHRRTTITGQSNRPSSNFGCATQHNLGLMVANPGDLERGRRMGPVDGARVGRPVRLYRLGKSYTPLTPEDGEGADAAASNESAQGDFVPPSTGGGAGDDE